MHKRAAAPFAAVLLGFTLVAAAARPQDAKQATAKELFERRLLPIFKSPNPSSCVQCHLSGLDLKQYILPSSEKTFLSLRDQGLIDLEKPDESKILKLIQMGEKDKAGAALIHEKARKAELEAFTEWIKACCADPSLKDAPKLAAGDVAGPKRPAEVIRHNRKDRLLESFESNVWAYRFRCHHCHMPGEKDTAKLVAEHGERVAWLKRDPAEAMNYLLTSKLIDPKQPERSLLLLKPLMAVKHVGGKKILEGDAAYTAIRAWIEDYGRVMGDKMTKASDVPAKGPARIGTEYWLRVAKMPDAWAERLFRMDLHLWDEKKKAFEADPIAQTHGGYTANPNLGKFAHGELVLLAPRESERAKGWARNAVLPKGRYQVKLYTEPKARLADWKSIWAKPEYVGSSTVDLDPKTGFPNAIVVEAGQIKR